MGLQIPEPVSRDLLDPRGAEEKYQVAEEELEE